MTRFGYTLMTEQSGPKDLVQYAAQAEDCGFDFEVMSDHYFPWLSAQGHAPYAWSVLGAVAHATDRVELMTYVTCPTMLLGHRRGHRDRAGARAVPLVRRRVVRQRRPADHGRLRSGHAVRATRGRRRQHPLRA